MDGELCWFCVGEGCRLCGYTGTAGAGQSEPDWFEAAKAEKEFDMMFENQ